MSIINKEDEEYKKRLEEARQRRNALGFITDKDIELNKQSSNNTSFSNINQNDYNNYQEKLKEARQRRNALGFVTEKDIKADIMDKQIDLQQTSSEEYINKINQYGLGNIDLTNRPIVKNEDGSISTIRSMSFQDKEGKEVLIPTVVNGKVVSDDEAIQHYYNTGEYLGKFDSVEEANTYAEQLHNYQSKLYSELENNNNNTKAGLGEKAWWVAKKTGAGVVGGTAGLGQAVLTDTANNLQKGNEKGLQGINEDLKNTNKIQKEQNQILNKAINSQIKVKEIMNDDKLSTVDKVFNLFMYGIGQVMDIFGSARENTAAGKLIDTPVQVAGTLLPEHSSQDVMNLNNSISKPIEEMNTRLAEEGQNYGTATQFIGNAMQAVGNMAPSIAATAITKNPNIGLATMGLSAKGQSTQEALSKGVELNKAVKIGDEKAMVEIGTEMLTGGVNIFGKGALDDILKKGIVDRVKNKVGKFLVKQGVNAAGETLEETISDIIGTAIDKDTVDPNATYTLKDWGETAIETTLTTFVLNLLTGGVVKDIQTIKNEPTEFKTIINQDDIKPLYVTNKTPDGDISFIQNTTGMEIENSNKNLNINPAIFYNNKTETYNVLDKNTGLLLDSSPYQSIIEAKTKFNHRILNLSDSQVKNINNNITKTELALMKKAQEFINEINQNSKYYKNNNEVSNSNQESYNVNTNDSAENKNLGDLNSNIVNYKYKNTNNLKNENNSSNNIQNYNVLDDINNMIKQIPNKSKYNQEKTNNIMKYVAHKLDNVKIETTSQLGHKVISSYDENGKLAYSIDLNNKKLYTGNDVKEMVNNLVSNAYIPTSNNTRIGENNYGREQEYRRGEQRGNTNVGQEVNTINQGENTKGKAKNEKSNIGTERTLSRSLQQTQGEVRKNAKSKGLDNYQKEHKLKYGKDFKATLVDNSSISKNENTVLNGFKRATGIDINVYNTNKGTTEGAFFNANEVYLKHNPLANKKSTNFRPYHELGHWLKKNKTQQWKNLYNIMNNTITDKQINDYKNVLNNKEIFDNMSKEQIKDYVINEIISDYMGNWANNIDNWVEFIENEQIDMDYANLIADITLENKEYGYNVFGTLEQQDKMYEEITNIMTKIINNGNANFINMEDRTYDNVGNKNVLPYAEEHPEIAQDIKDMAANFMEDLASSTPGERYKAGDTWTGQQRSTTQELADFKDLTGVSWDRIGEILNDIYEGKGNYALAKKMELELDKALTEGYRNIYGKDIMPNDSYIEKKSKIEGKDYSIYNIDENYSYELSPDELPFSDRNDVDINIKKNYNKYSSNLTIKEKNQIISEVRTWKINQKDGTHYIDLSAYGYKSYIYNKQGNNIIPIKRVEGSQEYLNMVRKGIENGTYRKSKTINQWLTVVKNQTKNNRSNNVSLSNRENNKNNVGLSSETIREQKESNRRNVIRKNSRNRLENSNKGSFSMEKNTKYSDRTDTNITIDSQGRMLTKEQQEFFKDSKILDRNGLLLTVYHGSSNKFTVFDNTYQGKNTKNAGFYGDGFYFTPFEDSARQYGKNKIEAYLNITNPFSFTDLYKYNGEDYYTDYIQIMNLTKINSEWNDIPVKFASEQTWGNISNDVESMLEQGKTDEEIDNAMYEKYGEIPEILNDRLYYYSKINGYKTLNEALKEQGYDGIINAETPENSSEIVAFNSNQIKNIDNTKPTDNSDIRYSDRYDVDKEGNYGFYSQLEKTINEKMPNTSNAQQIRGILNKAGIKQDEMKWIGLDDYLNSHSLEKISKQQILDYVKANQIYIETVQKGDTKVRELTEPIKKDIEDKKDLIKNILDKYNIDYEEDDVIPYRRNGTRSGTIGDFMADSLEKLVDLDSFEMEDGDYINTYMDRDGVTKRVYAFSKDKFKNDMQELADLYDELNQAEMELSSIKDEYGDYADEIGIPKYKDYVLEGGKNYQEKLYTVNYNENTNNNIQLSNIDEYNSPHWNEKNVLAHTRTQDFKDINGNKVLFIDEIQSDLHQEGRKKGYETKEISKKRQEINDRINELKDEYSAYEQERKNLVSKAFNNIKETYAKKQNEAIKQSSLLEEKYNIQNNLSKDQQYELLDYVSKIEEYFIMQNRQFMIFRENIDNNEYMLNQVKEAEKTLNLKLSKEILNKQKNKSIYQQHAIENFRIGHYDQSNIRYGTLWSNSNLQYLSKKEQNRAYELEKLTDKISDERVSLESKKNLLSTSRISDIFPFKKNWHEFVLRRLINDAVQQGYDEVAWTTGKQQRKRYNVGRFVDNIVYEKQDDGFVEFHAYKDSSSVDIKREVPVGSLTEWFGKDIANQIIDSKEKSGTIFVDDIDVDAKTENGMYLFYDQELPNYLNKYLKKWNSKVETITLAYADNKEQSEQMGFKITNEMRNSIMQNGQPLYADRNDFENDSNTSNQNYTPEEQEILKKRQQERVELAKTIKERGFLHNVLTSNVDKDFKKVLRKNRDNFQYEPISNAETMEKASEVVDKYKDFESAKNDFLQNDLTSATDTAVGELLVKKALAQGNYEEASNLTASLAEKLTTAGQTVQAAAMFKRMTADGMLLFAQRKVNQINKELSKEYGIDKLLSGKNAPQIELTEDKVKFINNLMQQMEGYENLKKTITDGASIEVIEREQDVIIAKIMAKIGEDIPTTMLDKITAWRNIALLLNTKTIARNLVSNALFSSLENIVDVAGVPLDKAISLITGERSLLLPNLKTQAKGLKKGLDYAIYDTQEGISTSLGGNKYEIKPTKTFKNKLLSKLETLTYFGVEGLDRPFMQAKYDSALEMIMKLEGLTYGKDIPTEQMKEEALSMAKYTTFKDKNAISDFLSKTKNTLNLGKSIGAADVIGLTYTNIPGNLTKKAIDYSPIGLYNIIKSYKNLKAKQLAGESIRQAQRELVQSTSRILIGTGIMSVSIAAFLAGVLTASGDEEDDKIKELTNQENYAINVSAFLRWITGGDTTKQNGDLYVTYSNYEPLSSIIAAAAEMAGSAKEGDSIGTIGYKGLTTWINTIAELSTLNNFSSLFEYGDLGGTLTRSLAQFPSSFIPTTCKQVAQLFEVNSKSSYSDNFFIKNCLNPILQRIPGLSSTLESNYDTMGNEKENYNGSRGLARLYNVFLNTSFTSTVDMDSTEQELYDLYLSTGSTDHLPLQVKNYFMYKGQKITLTAEEKSKYQETLGKRTAEAFKKEMATSDYKSMTDEDKVKDLKNIISDINNEVRGEVVLEPRGLAYDSTFTPNGSSLSKNGYRLNLTEDMQKEYEQVASEYYSKYKKQGIYNDEKLKEIKSKAKDYAKNYMFNKYKSNITKSNK